MYCLGLVHGWNGPLSRLHSNLAPASLENVNRTVVPLTVRTPMLVAGAAVSTWYPRVTLSTNGVTLVSVVVSVARYWR